MRLLGDAQRQDPILQVRLDAAGIAPALAAAAEGTSPATDALASAWYRREVVAIHLRRLLLGEEG